MKVSNIIAGVALLVSAFALYRNYRDGQRRNKRLLRTKRYEILRRCQEARVQYAKLAVVLSENKRLGNEADRRAPKDNKGALYGVSAEELVDEVIKDDKKNHKELLEYKQELENPAIEMDEDRLELIAIDVEEKLMRYYSDLELEVSRKKDLEQQIEEWPQY